MEIKKWNVYWVDLNPRMGAEPGKIRPVVVVQTDLLNHSHPSTIICPLTTRIDGQSRFLRVHLRKGEAGLLEKSDLRVDQLRAIDNRRFLKRTGMIGKESRKKLAENIRIVLN